MNEDRVLTMAKSALKLANIIRYENGHEIIDVSLLRTIPDGELMRFRTGTTGHCGARPQQGTRCTLSR